MLGSNRRASQTNIPSLSHRPPPPFLPPLTSPRDSLAKIVLTCRQSVIMPDFSLTHFQFPSYPSLSLTLSLQPHHPDPDTAHSVTFSLPFPVPFTHAPSGRFDKTAPGRYFQGVTRPPSNFLSTLFHKQALHSTSGGGKLNSLTHYSLIWHAQFSPLTKCSCLFCLLRQQRTR